MATITLERLNTNYTRITVKGGSLKIDSKVKVSGMKMTGNGLQFEIYSLNIQVDISGNNCSSCLKNDLYNTNYHVLTLTSGWDVVYG